MREALIQGSSADVSGSGTGSGSLGAAASCLRAAFLLLGLAAEAAGSSAVSASRGTLAGCLGNGGSSGGGFLDDGSQHGHLARALAGRLGSGGGANRHRGRRQPRLRRGYACVMLSERRTSS